MSERTGEWEFVLVCRLQVPFVLSYLRYLARSPLLFFA